MTQPVWPFPLARPVGYVDGDVPSGPELQAIQLNAATAADGRVWTDFAAVKLARYLTPDGTVHPHAICYDPASQRWLFGGATTIGSNIATVDYTYTGGRVFQAVVPHLGSGSGYIRTLAANGAGLVLAGREPASATTNKILGSTDGGASWTTRSIGASDLGIVQDIVWVPSMSLWLAAQYSVDAGIFSSPDGNTWTKRSPSPGYFIVRNTPTARVVAIGSGTSSTSYSYSDDGLNWTTQTFPVDQQSTASGCWSDVHGAFFVQRLGTIYKSATGLTGSWTSVASTGPNGAVRALGRMLFRVDGKASIDGGATWRQVLDAQGTVEFHTAPGYGVAAFDLAGSGIHVCMPIGY